MASFEEQVRELEGIVEKLESGNLPLEESVTLFESGMRLSAACKEQLAQAESRIRVILDPGATGDPRTEPLNTDLTDQEDSDEDDTEDRTDHPT